MNEKDRTLIEKCDVDAIPVFDLRGQYWCRVVSCHDGDTFTGVISLWGHPIKVHVRMNGYDSAEITSHDPQKKLAAEQAKSRLEELINGKTVHLEISTLDKYGRPLGEVTTEDDVKVNNTMLTEGHGYEYHGGKKQN